MIEKRLQRLKLLYVACSIPVIALGFLLLLLVVLTYDPFFHQWDYFRLLLGIGYFLAGILLFASYYGLKTRKIYTKFTGLIGCILSSIVSLVMAGSSSSMSSLFLYSLVLIVTLLLLIFTLVLWDDIPREFHLRLSPKIQISLIALVCIVVTFSVTYTWVNSYRDQEMKDFYVEISGELDDYCHDVVDGYRFIGYWSRTEVDESFAYEFLYNGTFIAYVSNQTESTNVSGTYGIQNNLLFLHSNDSSSSYDYTFTSDDTVVTIDGMAYTRR